MTTQPPFEAGERAGRPFLEPSGDYLLGTDDVGHDILSDLLGGARISLLICVTAAAIAVVVGGLLGAVTGYRRGAIDAALSFVGLGDPVRRSWGSMIQFASERGAFLTGAWKWWILPPGRCVALVVCSFAFIGIGLEERFDRRLASGRAGIH
jgi:ABC-type dipeptide/oligopeptide/nickel transport system permease subunit